MKKYSEVLKNLLSEMGETKLLAMHDQSPTYEKLLTTSLPVLVATMEAYDLADLMSSEQIHKILTKHDLSLD